jgi:hypothetical protein
MCQVLSVFEPSELARFALGCAVRSAPDESGFAASPSSSLGLSLLHVKVGHTLRPAPVPVKLNKVMA